MESIVATALNQALTQLAGQVFQAIAENPQGAIDFTNSLFAHPHPTGYDAIQDIWDAVEAGHLSHSAALNATAILAADLERQRQRPADQPPRPHTQPRQTPMSPLDIIRTWPEYQTLQR
jgi:hypothetical protein